MFSELEAEAEESSFISVLDELLALPESSDEELLALPESADEASSDESDPPVEASDEASEEDSELDALALSEL
jgi:hypothetical protein